VHPSLREAKRIADEGRPISAAGGMPLLLSVGLAILEQLQLLNQRLEPKPEPVAPVKRRRATNTRARPKAEVG